MNRDTQIDIVVRLQTAENALADAARIAGRAAATDPPIAHAAEEIDQALRRVIRIKRHLSAGLYPQGYNP